MAAYKPLTKEELRQRIKEIAESAKERVKAIEAKMQAIDRRQKLLGDLRKWMAGRNITPQDLLAMYRAMMPKRASSPVTSKKALHPEVRAMRKPTRGGKKHPLRGDHEFMAAIKKARVDKGLGVDQMGKKLGVSGASISNWEAGRYTPLEGTRQKIVKALGLPADLGKEATAAAMVAARTKVQLNGATQH